MSKQLPILEPCDFRRQTNAGLCCVHGHVGEPTSDQATQIDASWCKRCKIKSWPNVRPRKEPPAYHPGLIGRAAMVVKKVSGYAKAKAKWIAAGSPVRTKEEVNRIFATICQPCERYRPTKDGKGHCLECHCKRTFGVGGLIAKVEMATEDCPLAKWPTTAKPTTPPQSPPR